MVHTHTEVTLHLCRVPAKQYSIQPPLENHTTRMHAHAHTIKKNKEASLDASKDVCLEVNPEKTKYMLMSHSQNVGQKHSIKIVNRSFEDVVKFKYL
jgi:hypothetical protein